MTRTTLTYECDGPGLKISVPSTPFEVEYTTGGGNNLVVVPIGGNSFELLRRHVRFWKAVYGTKLSRAAEKETSVAEQKGTSWRRLER